MKRLLGFLLVLVLTAVLCLPASAAREIVLEADGMTLQVPSDFTVITPQNVRQMGDLLQEYGTTVTATDLRMREGNDLFIAVSSAMRCTLFFSRQETAVSASIGDLISVKDPEAARRLLLGDTEKTAEKIQELEKDGALFYRVDCGVHDGVGRLIYITVINGVCYTLSVVDNAGTLSDNINAMLDTVFRTWQFTVTADARQAVQVRERVLTVAFWICLPAAPVALFFLIRSLIRDFRRKDQEEKRRRNIPKRPRR